jgi:amidase
VNAIVARLDDAQSLAHADAADARLARGESVGALHGLPIAIKDLQPAVGFPFTRGSPLFARFMPAEDSLLVERLRAAGALVIGKTNVPEFGLGSHTYNSVYGTANDPAKSAGGSAAAQVRRSRRGCSRSRTAAIGGSLPRLNNVRRCGRRRAQADCARGAAAGRLGGERPAGALVADVAFL